MAKGDTKTIGRAEKVSFPELGLEKVPARIDTGARTATLWASSAKVVGGDALEVVLFDEGSPFYTGEPLRFEEYGTIAVASSNGHIQHRFKVRLLVKIRGKKVRAWFTLADRSSQVYPALIGRNVLLGKFIVDVKQGWPLKSAERQRIHELQATLGQDDQEEDE